MKAKYKYSIQTLLIDKADERKIKNAAGYKTFYCKCGREYRVMPDFEERARRGMVWSCSTCGFDITPEFIMEQSKPTQKSWLNATLDEVIDNVE